MKKCKKRNQKEDGITLIALVITIIVLLILAGITIATLTGENGMLNKANTAGEENKKKEYEEILKLIGNSLKVDKTVNNWSNKTYLDEFEKEIRKEDKLNEAEINRRNNETIHVITKEKYVYKIVENEVKYIGIQGENPPIDLTKEDITFNITPNEEYTNQDITIEIIVNTEIGTNILQYSTDGTTWINYEKPIVVSQNGAIYTRLINELDEIGKGATENITNIDKQNPNRATIVFSANKVIEGQNITATVTQSDEGVSGIAIENCKYVFTQSNEEIGTDDDDIMKYTGGTFSKEIEEQLTLNCSTSGNYYLHILTVDKAGNRKESISTEAVNIIKASDMIKDTQLLNEMISNPSTLDNILSTDSIISAIISNSTAFNILANNRDAFAKVCENANARQHMYNNYAVTESIIGNSATAQSVMISSSRFQVVNGQTPVRTQGTVYGDKAFVFGISQSQYSVTVGAYPNLPERCLHHGSYLNGGTLEVDITRSGSYDTGNRGMAYRVNRFASTVNIASYDHNYGSGTKFGVYLAIFKI